MAAIGALGAGWRGAVGRSMIDVRNRLVGVSDRRLCILVSLVLALIWTNNIFHFRISSAYGVFDPTSEGLVVGRLGRAAAEGILSQGGSLGSNAKLEGNPDPGKYWEQLKYFEHPELIAPDGAVFGAYLSQFGLQSLFFAVVDKLNPFPRQYSIGLYHFLAALMCAAVLMWIGFMFIERFGRPAFVGFVVPLAFEPLLSALAPNLYWAAPLWFLPMALSMRLINAQNRTQRRWLFVAIWLAVTAKALCGYEFITTVIVAAMVGCLLNTKEESLYSNVVDMMWTCAVGLAGFVMAVILHGYRFGFANILARAVERTSGGGETLDEELLVGRFASVSSVLRAYFMGNEYTLIKNFGVVFAVLAVIALLVFFEKKYSWFFGENRRELRSLSVAYFVSFAAPMSWLILAKAHSFAHKPIDFILWYIPTVPIGGALVALAIKEVRANRKEWTASPFRAIVTISIPAAFLLAVALVAVLDRSINEKGAWIVQAHTGGKRIFTDPATGVDFRFNENWFTVEYVCDRTLPSDVFFIHAFNGDAVTNHDFVLGDRIVFSPRGGKCYYAQTKSSQPITRIESGLVSGGKIIWRHEDAF
ncbi:hypothetical protein [Bradyrhizobium betae]|uniref:Uncharacterized protein n=1 Tax=Bradyrhizobium betae TaxID=244734 RepID=A0A5P6PBA3_9BRAD|nr:hypothetical protein [Bradyrhizobium betae]MCS3731651.1 hypothetical protein [Bradyrhizobium betae]QFI75649.1 hypothetical protein F8237_26555 [Bradyrhizobium betae]